MNILKYKEVEYNMKQAMINYIKNEIYDEFYTPPIAIYPLLKYIDRNIFKIVWEPTDFGGSEIVRVLKEHNFEVISSHISNGQNFFEYEPEKYDLIVTNPPYSLKTEFLRRVYDLGKPFCFLLPITTLEGRERGELFRKYGIQVIVLDRRINFSQTKKNVWFNTSWFCWGLNLPKDLIFETVE